MIIISFNLINQSKNYYMYFLKTKQKPNEHDYAMTVDDSIIDKRNKLEVWNFQYQWEPDIVVFFIQKIPILDEA